MSAAVLIRLMKLVTPHLLVNKALLDLSQLFLFSHQVIQENKRIKATSVNSCSFWSYFTINQQRVLLVAVGFNVFILAFFHLRSLMN